MGTEGNTTPIHRGSTSRAVEPPAVHDQTARHEDGPFLHQARHLGGKGEGQEEAEGIQGQEDPQHTGGVIIGRRQTKRNSLYDPAPFEVTELHGTQVVAKRGQERKTRDSQYWKKTNTYPRIHYDTVRQRAARRGDDRDYYPDIGCRTGT